MKVVKLTKHPYHCSTVKFAEEYLGIYLRPYQKLILYLMDFRDRFEWNLKSLLAANKKLRPPTFYARPTIDQRGLQSNLLICDDLCSDPIDK